MAKAKKDNRGRVKLGLNDLSADTYTLVQRLDDLVSLYSKMPIKDLSEIVDAIKTECGDDAAVAIDVDDYYGNNVDITWYRLETDEEWEKRLEQNKKRADSQRKKRVADKKRKEIDERVEFARLQKKYAED